MDRDMAWNCGIAQVISLGVNVYVARLRVDLRKSYDGLSMLVEQQLHHDPLSGHVFVFFNKRADKVKALYWDRNGFCVWQKRLEKSCFQLPTLSAKTWQLTWPEWQLLLGGVDVRLLKPSVVVTPRRVC